jgi:hypothetical protein
MANTTWIIEIQNKTNLDINWRDGEDHSRTGLIRKNTRSESFDGSGFCFPWVDHTKDELYKAIEFYDQLHTHVYFLLFQSYNKDTIQWLIPGSTPQYANNATDVQGPAGAGGNKVIIIQQNPKNPKELFPVLQEV